MFIKPRYCKNSEEKIYFSSETIINGDMAKAWMKDRICSFSCKKEGVLCREVIVASDAPDEITAAIPDYVYDEDGFILQLGEQTYIYAGEKAVHSAFATLEHLGMEDELTKMILWDKPFCAMRGYRLYTPAREQIETFKKTIDMLEFYRFNTVVIEVGAAMEYKKHPEINEAWIEFCKDVRSVSGRSLEIQEQSFDWQKNSIHADNALGSFITQEEMRDIVDYCHQHGINAIPEMPSLSHSDYLVMPHPELAERKEDPYPDTYCPSNPKSYELLFDLLEEVIDVFKPEIVNIGHDEYYSIGICEKCKNKRAEDLLAGDITKIHDFLSERGIRTMMWGDKLLNIVLPSDVEGGATGGAEIRRLSLTKDPKYYYIPATYKAIDLIPRDIIILNWSYQFGRKYDDDFLSRGFDTVFSNLDIYNISEWNSRIRSGIKGGFVSNWGDIESEAMQRNNQIMMLLSVAYAFWCEDYDSADNEQLFELVAAEASRWYSRNIKHPITITHTTDRLMKKYVFYDGVVIENEVWHMGNYIVSYSDGTTANLPVRYGYNISNKNLLFRYNNSGLVETVGASLPKKLPSQSHNPVKYTVTWLRKPPEICDEQVDYEVYYTCVYENPYPEKEIVGIHYESLPEPKISELDDPVIEKGNGVTTLEYKW